MDQTSLEKKVDVSSTFVENIFRSGFTLISSTFIENIYRSGLTLISSNDIITIKIDKKNF